MKRLVILILVVLLCGCIGDKTTDTPSVPKNNVAKTDTNQNNIVPNETQNITNETKIPSEVPIPFEIVEMGIFGKEEHGKYIHYTKDNKTIIELYMGKKPTAGYSISISKITKKNDKLLVYINESYREEGNAMVVTSPYVIAEVNGTYDNVVFVFVGNE
ncbi:protease complex subunit PrcB family protein [Methanotorris formicicus]|uniref:PrcB C-terminal domain-containing protein n=1 Tax=Methanotorris formicicus Mc-S-70 TaxID=647171 RepID=H1KY77_9EURY|nr:protease complex subunit PrcB family protein [Methanotorris formicicus]EHP87437.1 hypothetical protein MetfoDRAFT_0750 [Methanotorris formicicus Mc-S-70]